MFTYICMTLQHLILCELLNTTKCMSITAPSRNVLPATKV